MKQLVIIPGGFHPFHKGHKSLYDAAKKSFPQADIYIAATADTSTRPFPFDLKKKLAQLGGIPSERFIEVKSPFQPREITQHYDPENTTLIYVRSEKDRNTSPQPDQTKKNGEPSYLQSIHGRKKSELQPLSSHGYMAYLPTISFGSDMSSSTEIRNSWTEYNEQQKSQLIQNLYPATAKSDQLEKKVIQIFDQVLGSEQLSEKWSKKYKDSIDCSNPKGFSQRAHCQGKKKKQNEDANNSVMAVLKPVLENAVNELKNGNKENITEFLNQWEQISEIVDKAKQIANPSSDSSDYINEMFDRPARWRIIEDTPSTKKYTASVNGKSLIVIIERFGSFWEINFTVEGKLDVTGTGDEVLVFSTVLDIIKDFIHSETPQKVEFHSELEKGNNYKDSRTKLYNRLVKKFANQYGYNLSILDDTSDKFPASIYTLTLNQDATETKEQSISSDYINEMTNGHEKNNNNSS